MLESSSAAIAIAAINAVKEIVVAWLRRNRRPVEPDGAVDPGKPSAPLDRPEADLV